LLRTKLIYCIKENLFKLKTYAESGNVNDLYRNSMFYDSVILKTKLLSYLFIKNKKYLINYIDKKDFIYLESLSSLLKDYSKFHFADLWYFLYKKLPYFQSKVEKL